MIIQEERTSDYLIRSDERFDYAHFFVHEHAVEQAERPRYSAIWTAYSTYGVYGYFWSHMGEPFTDFIAQADRHYVLGKIAQHVHSDAVLKRSLIDEIRTARRDGRVTRDVARAAMKELRDLADEYSGEALAMKVYEADTLNRVPIEWVDVRCREIDPQAAGFFDTFWHKFVQAVRARSEAA